MDEWKYPEKTTAFAVTLKQKKQKRGSKKKKVKATERENDGGDDDHDFLDALNRKDRLEQQK